MKGVKILIYFLCLFFSEIIKTWIRNAGILLGAIPTVLIFLAAIFLARLLCKKLDEHVEKKKSEEYDKNDTNGSDDV